MRRGIGIMRPLRERKSALNLPCGDRKRLFQGKRKPTGKSPAPKSPYSPAGPTPLAYTTTELANRQTTVRTRRRGCGPRTALAGRIPEAQSAIAKRRVGIMVSADADVLTNAHCRPELVRFGSTSPVAAHCTPVLWGWMNTLTLSLLHAEADALPAASFGDRNNCSPETG
jgi:hypothetical protein